MIHRKEIEEQIGYIYIPLYSQTFFENNLKQLLQPSHISSALFFHQPSGKAQRLDSYVTQWALTCWNRKFMGSTGQCARWYSEDIRYYEEGDELFIFSFFGWIPALYKWFENELNMTWMTWSSNVLNAWQSFLPAPFFPSDLFLWLAGLVEETDSIPSCQKPTTEEGLHSLESLRSLKRYGCFQK